MPYLKRVKDDCQELPQGPGWAIFEPILSPSVGRAGDWAIPRGCRFKDSQGLEYDRVQVFGQETLIMSFLDMLGDSLRGAGKSVQKGKEAAIRSSEKMLRISRLKMDVQEMREKKDKQMQELALRVYELYSQSKLGDPELVAMCQEIKTLQWQIDERWTEINHLNKTE